MMFSDLSFAWTLALVTFSTYLVVHFAIFHFFEPKHRFKVLKNLFLVFAVLAMVCGWFLLRNPDLITIRPSTTTEVILSAVGFLWFLFLGFMLYFILVYRSVSLRVNGELCRRRGHAFSFDEIQKIYGTDSAFESRIEAMIRNGHIVRSGNSLTVTSSGRRIGGLALFWKSFLKLGIGG